MESNVDLEASDLQVTDNWEFASAVGPGAVTSRISVQKPCNIFSQFGQFKRKLIAEIGFEGVLSLRSLPKLNLKFSSFLMERVDADTCVITIDEGRSIKFTAADVNNVFGLPVGGKRISTYPCDLSEACIEYKKFAEELSDKGTHNLKAAEAILLKDIQEDSPRVAIEMFKIAAVIFIFGHLLCPSSKNDYTSVDYWGALNTTLEISQFDWCEFVIEHLLSAVRKLKTDLQTRHSTIHLVVAICSYRFLCSTIWTWVSKLLETLRRPGSVFSIMTSPAR
ncbi:hypothetical protein CFC21_065315 [Triticum aestivum]|uniref:Aminotransferase-like plant mobile domain-containing protein n=3 Tax=Triticum TaxID=4564 RepID=A0A9R0TLR5_TRITD|nr:uncharacterized protein LOC123103227 [Triticum aestivum]KAF7058203.1 hypothetical protein CFC21_065315 [Triticum aestivum]VAI16252.1 unnamed protein product [Triticum turgidum subsp. durum]